MLFNINDFTSILVYLANEWLLCDNSMKVITITCN